MGGDLPSSKLQMFGTGGCLTMTDSVIVDLEKAEKNLKPRLQYAEWVKVYEFLSACPEVEE